MPISNNASLRKRGSIMDHVRVCDVCKEEVLAFRPVLNRQDAPLGAIFLRGNRGPAMTRLHAMTLTISHHRPYRFNPRTYRRFSTFRTWPRTGLPDARRKGLSFLGGGIDRREHICPPPLSLQWDSHLASGWSRQTRTDLLSEEGRWQSQLCTSSCWWWWSPWPTQHPVNRKQPLISSASVAGTRENTAESTSPPFCSEILIKSHYNPDIVDCRCHSCILWKQSCV